MMTKNQSTQAPLPNVWQSISAGFDLTTRNLWILLIPIVLDFFLWLGPRLSFSQLMVNLVQQWEQDPMFSQLVAPITLESLGQTNLWASLSVPLLGIPTLMSGLAPAATPIPTPVIEIGSYLDMLLFYVLLSLVGLVLSALYLAMVAQALRAAAPWHQSFVMALRRFPRLWVQFIGLAVLFVILVSTIYLVTLPVLIILGLFSSSLVILGAMVQVMLIFWVVLYWFFVPQGLALNGRPLVRAVVESLQLIQRYLVPSMWLVIVTLLIRQMMDWLMLLADDGSWLTAVSLVAHAFVSTALIVATFIFYRDRYLAYFSHQPARPNV